MKKKKRKLPEQLIELLNHCALAQLRARSGQGSPISLAKKDGQAEAYAHSIRLWAETLGISPEEMLQVKAEYGVN